MSDFSKPIAVFVCFTALLATFACSGSHDSAQGGKSGNRMVVGSVGDDQISVADLESEFKNVYGEHTGSFYKDKRALFLLDRMVRRKVLEHEANEQKITVGEAELDKEMGRLLNEYEQSKLELTLAEKSMSPKQWREMLKSRMIVRKLTLKILDSAKEPTEKEIKAYYEENKMDFKWPERVHALQIMVDDESKAEQILQKLKAGADFGKMAKKWSQSPDGSAGGDLGTFSRGQMPPAFERTVFEIGKGKMSGVIKSVYGFHIFKVVDRLKPRAMKLAESHKLIKDILSRKTKEKYFAQWLTGLKDKWKVKTFPERLKKVS